MITDQRSRRRSFATPGCFLAVEPGGRWNSADGKQAQCIDNRAHAPPAPWVRCGSPPGPEPRTRSVVDVRFHRLGKPLFINRQDDTLRLAAGAISIATRRTSTERDSRAREDCPCRVFQALFGFVGMSV